MKKQINPTIKAHLIRSAFYVTLLLAVCVIPFALAQRTTAKRSVAKPKMAAKTKVVAAAGKQSRVPGGLAGTVQRPQRQPGAVDTNLPYDLRRLSPQAPKFPYSSVRDRGTATTSNATGIHKRVSSVPTTTAPLGIGRLRFLRQPKAPQVVLYDQYDNASVTASLSATFTDFPTFSSDLADDFVVPGGETWNVDSIDADGVYFNGSGPATDWNVFIYTDSGGLPGTQIFSATNIPITQVGTTFTANLAPAAVLSAGTYWIEIQANMTFATQGEWGWTDRIVQSGNSAAFQNPGGGLGVCPTWTAKLTCIPTAGGPDQVYRINGTTGGGGCTTCTDYTLASGTSTFGSGVTDIGSHCDDCDTPVTLPFPVQLYDQSFATTVQAGSNGHLTFGVDNATFGITCSPFGVAGTTYADAPYWTDQRTDTTGGCASFPGGTCGIFTTTTGSAPNRIFYIEWRTVYFGSNTDTLNYEVALHEDCNPPFEFIYNTINPASTGNDSELVVGVKKDDSIFNQFGCDTTGGTSPPVSSGEAVTAACIAGGTPTPTPTATPTCTPGAGGGMVVGSGMTLGFAPNGWNPTLASNTVNYTFANSQAAPNEFALFETHDPWGSTIVKDAITGAGHTFTEFTPNDLAGFDFSQYRVVILNWDDTFLSDFNAQYTAAIPALEAYVNAGGVVWVQAAVQGSPGDVYPMPFGGQGNAADFAGSDPVVDPANPMMAGMPNPINGNSASHVSYTGLPGAAHTVVISGNTAQPTLYELFPGGGGCTPTPTPTATPSCTPVVVTGSIDAGDPTQTDRLFRSGIPQTCPASTSCSVFGDGAQHHYDEYTFTNTTGATQCVTIDTNTACTGTNFIFVAAYLGTFDPVNICTNWIGDSGGSPNPDQPFQVNVDPGQTFIVVVSEVTADAGCPGYTVTITGLCQQGTPTPTPTATATPTCPPQGGAGVWNPGTPYPSTVVRYGFAQTATHFYVFGGVDNGNRLNTVNRMDLATGTWEPRAGMPFTSEAPTCALDTSSGIVYCAEGDTGNNFAAYNIATDSWTPLANTPNTDDYGSASGAFNGKVFLVGGTTGFISNVWVYDIAGNTWSPGTAAPDPFLLAGYQQVGQFLYLAGGWTGGAPNGLTTTRRLDMSSAPGTWDNGPAFTMGRSDLGLAYDAGTNTLYALGGDLQGGGFFDSTSEVDELSLAGWPGGTWVTSPPDLPLPVRQASQAGFYGNGDIWAVGGIDGTTFQFLNEVWHRNNGGGCVTPTPTVTVTPTPTVTVTPTPTVTVTPTPTVTVTPTPTTTVTPTPTPIRQTPTPRPRPTPWPRPTP